MVVVASTGPVPTAFARQDVDPILVRFVPGDSSASFAGRVSGRVTQDYLVSGGAGQDLSVSLTTDHLANYFNVNPHESITSMFTGSTSGNEYSGVLADDGTYRVRVYLMPSAARRNETANYTVTIGLTGERLPAVPDSLDARIPGTPFHASTSVPCAHYLEESTSECEALVVRRGFDGTATVVVRWPSGMARKVLFIGGRPVSADLPGTLRVQREGDITRVGIGTTASFEIPDALLFGG